MSTKTVNLSQLGPLIKICVFLVPEFSGILTITPLQWGPGKGNGSAGRKATRMAIGPLRDSRGIERLELLASVSIADYEQVRLERG